MTDHHQDDPTTADQHPPAAGGATSADVTPTDAAPPDETDASDRASAPHAAVGEAGDGEPGGREGDPVAAASEADDGEAVHGEAARGGADASETDGGEADGEHTAELLEEEPPDYEQRAEDDGRTPGQLLEALEEAQHDRDDYLDALQRSRAEFDNFRRRSAREAAGARAAGVGRPRRRAAGRRGARGPR